MSEVLEMVSISWNRHVVDGKLHYARENLKIWLDSALTEEFGIKPRVKDVLTDIIDF